METFMKEFEHLKIQLEDIKSTTNNFDKSKLIGSGGFGQVYVGELSHYKGHSMVAIKCLDRKYGQGGPEFWKEIMILNCYTHEKLIAVLGFCIQGGEMILVYEYASNGSLERHLSSIDFMWTRRLQVCLDAAMGLTYLHDTTGIKELIIHRDIKSSNILLDANWNAKVSDMGLSKIVPANQQNKGHFTNPAGTLAYCDPLYRDKCFLTKESDVYSFGGLLLEVLCGRLCYDYNNGQLQVHLPTWKESYKQKKLQEIIFRDLKELDLSTLKIYSDVAFKCLQESPEERPMMSCVVETLETALKYQELYERLKLPEDYKKMLLTATDPLNCRSESELKMLLLKGSSLTVEKRFAVGCYEPLGTEFKTHVRTQFLSPGITYSVNLVFKNKIKKQYIGLEYKLEGDESNSYAFLSDVREDGWLTAELFQFTSDQQTVDLEIMFYTKWCPSLLGESIEFRPLENVEHEVLRDKNVDKQPRLDTETYWEQKLPIDYKDIIKWSKDNVQGRTMKELYYILCEGLLIKDGEEWFSLAKDGKKCLMLPAITILEENKWEWKSLPETRFEEVAECISDKFDICCKFRSNMLSPQTTYATYLVYKLPHDYKDIKPPVQVVDENSDLEEECNIFLSTPQTPVIKGNVKIQKTYNASFRPMIKGLPKMRSDGWMEVHVLEFQTRAAIKMISTRLRFSSYDKGLKGITVQGLEFRPV